MIEKFGIRGGKVNFSKQLRKNAYVGSTSAVLNLLVVAVTYPAYIHYLGYERYGLWLVLATVLAFSRVGDMGISQALAKLVAEAKGNEDHEAVRGYLREAFKILALVGCLVGVTVALLLPFFTKSGCESRELLVHLALLAGFGVFMEAFPGMLSGLGRMDLGQGFVLLGRTLGALVSVVALSFDQGLMSFVWGTAVTYLCVWGCGVYLLHPHMSLSGAGTPHFRSRLLKTGGGIVGGNILSLLMHPVSCLLLASHNGLAAVPIHDLAYRGAMQLRSVLEAGLRSLMPAFSHLEASNHLHHLFRIRRKAIFITLLGGGVIYASVAFCLEPFLKVWLGKEYLTVLTEVCYITLSASFLSLIGVPLYYFAMGIGHVHLCFFTHLIQAVVNVVILGTCIFVTGELSLHLTATAVLTAFAMSYIFLFVQLIVMKKAHFGSASAT